MERSGGKAAKRFPRRLRRLGRAPPSHHVELVHDEPQPQRQGAPVSKGAPWQTARPGDGHPVSCRDSGQPLDHPDPESQPAGADADHQRDCFRNPGHAGQYPSDRPLPPDLGADDPLDRDGSVGASRSSPSSCPASPATAGVRASSELPIWWPVAAAAAVESTRPTSAIRSSASSARSGGLAGSSDSTEPRVGSSSASGCTCTTSGSGKQPRSTSEASGKPTAVPWLDPSGESGPGAGASTGSVPCAATPDPALAGTPASPACRRARGPGPALAG